MHHARILILLKTIHVDFSIMILTHLVICKKSLSEGSDVMKKFSKLVLYIIGATLFSISFTGMIIYGYKTFYIDKEPIPSNEYSYHFALVSEEIDNEYWRLIEQGARKAAAEHDIYLEYVGPPKADNDQLLSY